MYKEEKIVIPDKFLNELAQELHNIYVHIGHKKVYKMINEDFVTKNMKRKIYTTLKSFKTCQKVKYRASVSKAPWQLIKVEKLNELQSIDFIDPLATARPGMKNVLVCLDAFSKFVVLYPLRNATKSVLIKIIFENHVPNHGKPISMLKN